MARKKRGSKVAKGVGALAIAALLLGLYLGGDFGFGGGNSGGEGDNVLPNNAKATTGGPIENADTEIRTGLEDDVLTVLIDGREFFVMTKKGEKPEYQRATDARLTDMARTARGDDTGVRVRVVRRRTARVSAGVELGKLLAQAGLPDHTIHWQKQYVE